jgi:hypothetical protein
VDDELQHYDSAAMLDVLVAGVAAPKSKSVERAVRRVLDDLHVDDASKAAVLPSDGPDLWDVGVKKADGWAIVRIDATIDNLAVRLEDPVREMLSGRRRA